MKTKLINIINVLAVVVLIFSTSCKKEIDIDAVGFVQAEDAITKEDDLFALLNSGYFAMAEGNYYGGNFQVQNELLGDHISNFINNGNYQAIYNRNVNIFNTSVSDLYSQMSKPVFQGNLVIDNIGLASAANKNNLEGQAKFMRSIAWFDLVRLYAQPYTTAGAASTPGIPLRLNGQRQKPARSSVAEVYQQIIAGLKDAENLLPATNGVLATKWAAKALLAKVYFQMNDFPNAYAYANDVISNGGFAFDADIMKRYSAAGTTENIFYLINESNPGAGTRFGALRDNYRNPGNIPTLTVTDALYAKATSVSTDARADWYSKRTVYNVLGKFDTINFRLPVIHLTEIKLIRAESAAETGQNLPVAIADMNDIIIRAYGASSSFILSASADAVVIKDAARRERELELVGEGNRVQDLKRRGAKGELVTIRGAAYNCPGLIFPFPTNEATYLQIQQNQSGGCN